MAWDIFQPNGFPKHTYVTRDQLHHERLLRQWAQSSHQIASVSGPSKAGKTVLVQRVVGAANLVTVSGASVRAPDQLWERVLDWWGEPHALTASHIDTAGKTSLTDKGAAVNLPVVGGTVKTSTGATSGTSETTQATVNRRGLPQVVQELADSPYTLLLDDFHYIPAAIQGDVAQQLKDAASRGVRICVASVPHRADNVVRALPELRGRVLAVDLDYWNRKDLLEIPRLGSKLLGINVDDISLAMFATEAAGSPQLMQSICLTMCYRLDLRERVEPSRAITLEPHDRKEILFGTTLIVDFRTLVHALVSGPRARPGERKQYVHHDGMKGDVYLTLMRAMAADPPRLSFEYAELTRRLEELCRGGDAPDGASIVRTCVTLGQIASGHGSPPPLEWDEQDQILVIPDPYLLFYLRWSNWLTRESEENP